MLSVFLMAAFILGVTYKSFMLSVIMLNVVVLSVAVPFYAPKF
jgi:hypothetical protein